MKEINRNLRVAIVMDIFKKNFPSDTISIVNIDDDALEVYVYDENGMIKSNFLIYHSIPEEDIVKYIFLR